MKSVAMKLALSADASEEAVLAEVAKILNRATTAEGEAAPLRARWPSWRKKSDAQGAQVEQTWSSTRTGSHRSRRTRGRLCWSRTASRPARRWRRCLSWARRQRRHCGRKGPGAESAGRADAGQGQDTPQPRWPSKVMTRRARSGSATGPVSCRRRVRSGAGMICWAQASRETAQN